MKIYVASNILTKMNERNRNLINIFWFHRFDNFDDQGYTLEDRIFLKHDTFIGIFNQ